MCVGVLDIDSAELNTFDDEDRNGLELLIKELVESGTDFSVLTDHLK